MAGDVPHRHGEPAVLQRQHVVEVAPHLGRRQVGVRDVHPGQARRQVGEDRALDPPRRLQLHPLALAVGDPPHVRRDVLVAVDELLAAAEVAEAPEQRHRQQAEGEPPLELEGRLGGGQQRVGREQDRRHEGRRAAPSAGRCARKRTTSAAAKSAPTTKVQPSGSTAASERVDHGQHQDGQQRAPPLPQPAGGERQEAQEDRERERQHEHRASAGPARGRASRCRWSAPARRAASRRRRGRRAAGPPSRPRWRAPPSSRGRRSAPPCRSPSRAGRRRRRPPACAPSARGRSTRRRTRRRSETSAAGTKKRTIPASTITQVFCSREAKPKLLVSAVARPVSSMHQRAPRPPR